MWAISSNTSNIAFYNSVRLDELWLQKSFWEKRLSIKVGNMAVDNEFFLSSSSALFINGTFGAFSFIGANVPNAPIYPLASPGVRVQFLPTSSFYVMAGVYGMDNNADPTANNKNGVHFAMNPDSGMLVMSEAGLSPQPVAERSRAAGDLSHRLLVAHGELRHV